MFDKIFKACIIVLFVCKGQFWSDIYPQIVSDFRVNTDTINENQFAAKLGFDGNGNFVSVWFDSNPNDLKIRGQIFDSLGNRIGSNFTISSLKFQTLPSIAVRKNGSFAVVWCEANTKFRIFDKFGLPISNEIILEDSCQRISSIGTDSIGNFVVAWEKFVSLSRTDIHCQIIDSLGVPKSPITVVNDDNLNLLHLNPAVLVFPKGNFNIVWNDPRPPSQANCDDIYIQLFDIKGNKISNNVKINDDFGISNLQHSPKISSDATGNFIVAWNDDRLENSYNEVYAQRFSNGGKKEGINFRVTEGFLDIVKAIASVDMRTNGDFIVSWTEYDGQPKPFFQRFRINGNKIGNKFLVSNLALAASKIYTDAKILQNNVISVWSDNRNLNYDIYCNIRSFSNPDTVVNIRINSENVPSTFHLFQNYPNPFNGTTVIKFDISKSDYYWLDLYDLKGQKIQSILNQPFIPGTYKINFTFDNLSTGVYHYVLSSSIERISKTLILIK